MPIFVTHLSIECPFIIFLSLFVLLYDYQIWSWSIQWCRITPSSAQTICRPVIDIVIRVNDEPSCIHPDPLPTLVADRGTKNSTCLVDAHIWWTWLFRRKNRLQECQNVCWGLWFCKFGPSDNDSTWSTDCFNAIEPGRWKIVLLYFLLLLLRCIMGLDASIIWSSIPDWSFHCRLKNSAISRQCLSLMLLNIFLPLILVLQACLCPSDLLH